MRLFKNIDNYITDRRFKIIYLSNYINIINYIEVIDFNDREIKISYDGGILKIIGSNLVISKMLDDEILIIGSISKIEL